MTEANFLLKYADARVYGVYKLCEVFPLDPDYNSGFETGCYWDGDNTTDPDNLFSWIYDYYDGEEDTDILKRLDAYDEFTEDDKDEKWEFLRDFNDDESLDGLDFYYYSMEYKLCGIAFCYQEAKEIKDQIDENLNPYIETLSRHQLSGFANLNKIAEYLKEQAQKL